MWNEFNNKTTIRTIRFVSVDTLFGTEGLKLGAVFRFKAGSLLASQEKKFTENTSPYPFINKVIQEITTKRVVDMDIASLQEAFKNEGYRTKSRIGNHAKGILERKTILFKLNNSPKDNMPFHAVWVVDLENLKINIEVDTERLRNKDFVYLRVTLEDDIGKVVVVFRTDFVLKKTADDTIRVTDPDSMRKILSENKHALLREMNAFLPSIVGLSDEVDKLPYRLLTGVSFGDIVNIGVGAKDCRIVEFKQK